MQASAEADTATGLRISPALRRFVENELLPGTSISPSRFWLGLAELVAEFTDRNRTLLNKRKELQAQIDAWFIQNPDRIHEAAAQEAFLREIGYLVEAPDTYIDRTDVDDEIGRVAGPQLVVPITNARYALNAANARWGSLYDAVYGTDVLGDPPADGPYDPNRGARVVAWVRDFLDEVVPLLDGSHADAIQYRVSGGALAVDLEGGERTTLACQERWCGYRGEPSAPVALIFEQHGLKIEVFLDPESPIGASDRAGIADVVVEAALTAIMDFEDSVATVDVEDKITAYRNWLGLMQGTLTAEVDRGGGPFTRRLASERTYTTANGDAGQLRSRALMLVRHVGLHLTTDAIRDANGEEIHEGLLDALVTVAAALHDLRGATRGRNSRTGSVYVVKPKLHGPEEVAFTNDLLNRVERILGLEPHTVKVGVMDEERRTSVNLAGCIHEARSRLAFINTGFLDRTGDEIHTAMRAGPMVRKEMMKSQLWFAAYEDGNVDVGLECGLAGRAQIGKGMWAAPNRMAAMLEEKVAHPLAGANCAWVPSPTAATLHSLHYHRVDVHARQAGLQTRTRRQPTQMLTLPVAEFTPTDRDRLDELENNAQGILGYVVRWVDQGIGCSTVPDIHGVGLMEDRATLRIASQHIANWLLHGVTTPEEVTNVMRRMAVVVDEQNASDPGYRPMAPDFDGPAFRAAAELVFEGASQPSGYTEQILRRHRLEAKHRSHTEGESA